MTATLSVKVLVHYTFLQSPSCRAHIYVMSALMHSAAACTWCGSLVAVRTGRSILASAQQEIPSMVGRLRGIALVPAKLKPRFPCSSSKRFRQKHWLQGTASKLCLAKFGSSQQTFIRIISRHGLGPHHASAAK
jgi:hypothetical protein